MTVAEAIGDIVEELLTRCRNSDVAGLQKALRSPLLNDLDRRHLGLANVHLSCGCARLLVAECPPGARDERGVPLLDKLIGDGAERREDIEARIAIGNAAGQSTAWADAKASHALYAAAIPLAQRFLKTWVLAPQSLPEFIHAESTRSDLVVDAMLSPLLLACFVARNNKDARNTSASPEA